MGRRKGSDCGANAHNLTLCKDNTKGPCKDLHHNVTQVLELLRNEGGADVATSIMLYCGLTINTDGTLNSSQFPSPGCKLMIPALAEMGIRAEVVVGAARNISPVRKFIRSLKNESISALVAHVAAHRLRGVSFDFEFGDSTASDAKDFAAFLAGLRLALRPLDGRVTVYSTKFTKMTSDIALLSKTVDGVLDGACYNGKSYKDWLSNYNRLLHPGVNRSAVAPAMMAGTGRGTWNCDNASFAERYDKVVADGLNEIAIFGFDATTASFHPGSNVKHCFGQWLPYAKRFIAGG